MSCLGCNAPPYLHTPRCQQELTFAEAIQLVEGSARDVEFRCKGGDWAILTKRTQLTVEQFANWEFRRAKPKRSRVQEMVESFRDSDSPKLFEVSMAEAIRAVCEWLRTYEAAHVVAHDLAGAVEREFLVPR